MSERDFQREALEWLKNDPRVGFVTQTDSDRSRNRKFRKGKAGLPDCIGYCVDGRGLYIEFKAPKGIVSEEQKLFIERARAFRCRAGIARTLGDLELILCQQ